MARLKLNADMGESFGPMSHAGLPRLEPAGSDGWMIRLFGTIEENNLLWLTALTRDCEAAFGATLVDLVPSYTTLLVIFDPLQTSAWQAREQLVNILARLVPDDAGGEGDLHELATWYDPSVGADLARDRDGFSFLKVGDRVRFVTVDRHTFENEGGDPTPMAQTCLLDTTIGRCHCGAVSESVRARR